MTRMREHVWGGVNPRQLLKLSSTSSEWLASNAPFFPNNPSEKGLPMKRSPAKIVRRIGDLISFHYSSPRGAWKQVSCWDRARRARENETPWWKSCQCQPTNGLVSSSLTSFLKAFLFPPSSLADVLLRGVWTHFPDFFFPPWLQETGHRTDWYHWPWNCAWRWW